MTRLSCQRFKANKVPAAAQPDSLQPRQPMAAAGAPRRDRQVVADELAAAAGKDRRPSD
jgi:hypothetical protein